MTRTISIPLRLLCAGVLVLFVGCGPPKPTLTTGQPYDSPFNHFEITPPTGWEEQTNVKMPQGRAEAVFTSQDGTGASLTLIAEPAENGETLESDKKRVAFGLSQAFPNYKEIAQADTSVSGIPGYAITFTTERIGKPRVWMQQTETLRNRKWYTFSVAAPDATHAQYEAAFRAALTSLRWK